MIRLVIADDHAIVRTGLRQIFSQVPDLEVIAEADSGGEVLECLRRTKADLLLMDVNMPGVAGSDLVTRVKAQWPDIPILALSMHNEPSIAARVLRAGASGYLTKDCDLDELLPAIRKIAAGGRYISAPLAEKIVFYDNPSAQGAPHLLLTDREMEVFRMLVVGMGVSEIATRLSISGKTVSTHKARMMEKLNLSTVAGLIRYAMEHELLS